MNDAVRIESLSVRFGDRVVLNDLNLTVAPREVVAISGRSGSGKSTLLSCILGLLVPQQGSIHVAGQEVSALSRTALARLRGCNIGTVFQHAELLPNLTAVENVALPALLQGDGAEEAGARALALLARLEVESREIAARDLSGGERQRTAVARALINGPSLVLADEPTGSLDAELRETALTLLIDTVRECGAALILVTHDPAVASRADRHLRLSGGTLTPAAR